MTLAEKKEKKTMLEKEAKDLRKKIRKIQKEIWDEERQEYLKHKEMFVGKYYWIGYEKYILVREVSLYERYNFYVTLIENGTSIEVRNMVFTPNEDKNRPHEFYHENTIVTEISKEYFLSKFNNVMKYLLRV